MIEVRTTDVFDKWYARLRDPKAKAAINVRIARFRRGLIGDCKSVGQDLLEARIHLSSGYRIYFVQRGDALIILLCGGNKSSQSNDIAKARKMLTEE